MPRIRILPDNVAAMWVTEHAPVERAEWGPTGSESRLGRN